MRCATVKGLANPKRDLLMRVFNETLVEAVGATVGGFIFSFLPFFYFF